MARTMMTMIPLEPDMGSDEGGVGGVKAGLKYLASQTEKAAIDSRVLLPWSRKNQRLE